MQRRDFHRWAQAHAMALALAPWQQAVGQAGPDPRRWRDNPFTLGVASGQPRPDTVLLWTRLVVGPQDRADSGTDAARVVCEVFADEALRQRVWHSDITTDAQRGHSVHVQATGLLPGRTYWYRFRCGDAISPVGRTRTAPRPTDDVRRLRLALASCQHYEQGEYVAHADIARQDLDLVVFVGDYIYESTNPRLAIRKHTGGEPKTLDEYRQRYALYKSDPHLQAAHAAHPWLLMWDDHEVVNDYAADRDTRNTPLEVFMQRRAAAYQAYFEHQPLALGPDPSSPWGASMRLHQHLPWGRLADLWTLDCRQYRSPQACQDPNRGGGRVVTQCAELDEPGRSMLGAAQEDWLYQGLRQSSATWKLLAQATQISPTSVSTPLGRATYTDAWDGYPQARRRLLQTLSDGNVADVLTLGGDVHMNVAAKLRLQPNDDNSPVVASEFVATSITSRGLGEGVLNAARSANPDIVYARSDERGYALIHIEPESAICEFRTTPFPAGTRADLSVQARFQVERGRPGPVKL